MAIAKIPIEEEFATVMLDSKSKLDTGSELTSPVFLSADKTTLELTICPSIAFEIFDHKRKFRHESITSR